jgi:hypothetical protein
MRRHGLRAAGILCGVGPRLQPHGALAKADDEDTTQVRLRLEVAGADAGWQALVTACPPDFVLDGPVFESVRETFAAELGGELQEKFSQAGIPAFEPEIRDLIRSGGDGSLLMRVRREGDEDTNLFVLTGDLIGRGVALLLKGEFELKTDGSGEVADWDHLEVLYAGLLRPDALVLDDDAQDWLRSLAVVARNWLRALP